MVNLARNILATAPEVDADHTIFALYPTKEELEAFSAFYDGKPQACLGACEPFGSALFLISSNSEPDDKVDNTFDNGGHSIPLRVALYMAEIMQSTMLSLPAEKAAEVLFFLCIVHQLLKSQGMSGDKKKMYRHSCDHVESFNAQLHNLLLEVAGKSTDWRRNCKEEVLAEDVGAILDTLLKALLDQSHGSTPLAFYSGLALSDVLATIVLVRGSNFECTEARLKDLKVFAVELDRPFTTLAILSGFGQALRRSDSVERFCKTLVGMIHGIDGGPLSNSGIDKAFRILCLLNGCLDVYGEDEIPTHTTRMPFVIKRMISWFDDQDFSGQNFAVASEACRVFTKLLPALKYSAGSFWSDTLTRLCMSPWILYDQNRSHGKSSNAPSESELFVLCLWSLKLYSRLARLKDIEDEAAFAVKDAFEYDQMQMNLNRSLLGLFKHTNGIDTISFTPYGRPVFAILQEILRPEISKIPIAEIELGSIYPLINSYMPATQAIAFETVKRALPKLIDDLTLKVVVDEQGSSFSFPH